MKQYIALTLLSATIDWKKPRVLVLAGEGRGRNTRVPEFSSAVDGNHHILAHVYCGLPESDKGLVLRRAIPSVQSLHIGKLENDHPIWQPMFCL